MAVLARQIKVFHRQEVRNRKAGDNHFDLLNLHLETLNCHTAINIKFIKSLAFNSVIISCNSPLTKILFRYNHLEQLS